MKRGPGGDVLAIPHNGNLSNGLMFGLTQPFTDLPIDQDYVEARARWEPLYEVTQTKGDGETHPFLSPNDEFADFETWDKGNLDVSEAKTPEMLAVRICPVRPEAGTAARARVRHQPLQVRHGRSTDAHTGLAAVEEDNFWGKVTPMEPNPERLTRRLHEQSRLLTVMEWEVASAGYTAVWARENTRESIFDAMERRETYATTGTRMACASSAATTSRPRTRRRRNPAMIGYTKGVPMGGELRPGRGGPRADLPCRGAARPDRRQPRPLPDRQGLDGRRGQDA